MFEKLTESNIIDFNTFETAEQRNSRLKSEYRQDILKYAAEITGIIEDTGIEPEHKLNIVALDWATNVIDQLDCWVITSKVHTGTRPTKIGGEPSRVSYKALSGFALTQLGDILKFGTSLELSQKPELIHIIGVHDKEELITDKNIGMYGYVDTGIKLGLWNIGRKANRYQGA